MQLDQGTAMHEGTLYEPLHADKHNEHAPHCSKPGTKSGEGAVTHKAGAVAIEEVVSHAAAASNCNEEPIKFQACVIAAADKKHPQIGIDYCLSCIGLERGVQNFHPACTACNATVEV